MESQVFTYDAWAHQNDPPRRAFLQELIHFLISKSLTLRSEWQRKLDQLNGQIEDTMVTKTPLFTTSGAVIFFYLLMCPFRARSEEHTSALQPLIRRSNAFFFLQKKKHTLTQ